MPAPARLHLHLAALGRVLDRVVDEVDQHLAHAILVGQRVHRVRGHDELDAVAIGAPARGGRDLARERGHVDGPERELHRAGLEARRREQAVDEPRQALGLGGDVAHERRAVVVAERRVGAQERLGESVDRGQRRAQLVRDGRDEVGLDLVEPALVRDVADREDGAGPLLARIAQRRAGDRQPDLAPAALEPDLHRGARPGRGGLEAARAVPSVSPSSLRSSSPSSRPSTRRARRPVTRSAAAFQRVMRSSASEATIASATWARIASPASFSCATRSYRSAFRRATAAELASAARPSTSSARKRARRARVHGEHALDLAVRRLHGHAEVGGETGVAHDRLVGDARVGREIGDRDGRGTRERLGRDRVGRERAAHGEQLGGLAEHRARDELAALEQAQGAGVGGEQVGGLRDDLAQDRARLEVGREQRGDALQLARERARAVLGLLQRGALERGDGRLLQALGEREVGVAEGARRVPGDGHHARPLARAVARSGTQRSAPEPRRLCSDESRRASAEALPAAITRRSSVARRSSAVTRPPTPWPATTGRPSP